MDRNTSCIAKGRRILMLAKIPPIIPPIASDQPDKEDSFFS